MIKQVDTDEFIARHLRRTNGQSENIHWISAPHGVRLVSCCETRDIVLDDDVSWISNVRLASKRGRMSISETFPASSRAATAQTNSASRYGKRARARALVESTEKRKKNEKKIEEAQREL